MNTTQDKKTRKGNRSPDSGRSARFEARMTKSQRSLLERAAAYAGRSLTDFVVSTLTSAADAIIHQHEVIRLNPTQSQTFVEALLKPLAPNAALRQAARKYRRTVKSS